MVKFWTLCSINFKPDEHSRSGSVLWEDIMWKELLASSDSGIEPQTIFLRQRTQPIDKASMAPGLVQQLMKHDLGGTTQ